MDTLERTIATLEALVAIPTVPGVANAEIVDFILSATSLLDVRVRRLASPLGDADGLILSAGPDVPGGVILSGHLDVVPVEGQTWISDPFQLRRDGDRLIGRGACDMKGFVACALTQLSVVDHATAEVPLHIVLSADEETGCRSIETLIAEITSHLPPVRGVLVGEPTGLRPVNRHRASATHEVAVRGRAAHASIAEEGFDAVMLAVKLMTWLEAETSGSVQDAERSLHTVTMVSGGSAVNTVADACDFVWDMRLAPGKKMAIITNRFDAYGKRLLAGPGKPAGIASITRKCTAYFPGLAPSEPCAFGETLKALTGTTEFQEMPFGTEAGFFQDAGFNVYVCGPGDVSDAHTPNESIAKTELARCLDLLGRMSAGHSAK